ncbi:acid protease-like protein [Phanerochaete sordida]|uniref:Acid protease-like protein n=1 Tax=Phanerochaete sordida TaxID=48140 RepID=A0A9P3LEZ1_9APHY|nr:acid protease-like protein [Phanerochaete sordida]
MRLQPFLSFVLAAVQYSSAKAFSRRALTAGNIQQYAENIIIVKDDLPGLLLEIDVGDNEVLVQVDLGSSDLFVGGQLNGADKWNASTAQALEDYPFFMDPISPSGNILETTVSIGGKSAEQTFIFNAQNPFTELSEAFPQLPAVGVLGLGPTGASAIHSVLPNSHSPLDALLLVNASSPYVTFFFLGSELAYGSSDPVPAGFFSVGAPVDLPALLPTVNGVAPPDLSGIHTQPAIPLGALNTFPLAQILHGGQDIPLTSTAGATSGAVAVLATTTPFNVVPAGVARAIYGGVPGAALDAQTGLWHVPCGTPLVVQLVLAQRTVVLQNDSVVIHAPGTAQCVGSFVGAQTADSNWDVALGTTFLENAYVLLGYADTGLTQPILRVLPYADIAGAQAYDAALGAGLGMGGALSPNSSAPDPAAQGASTRFTTVTVTHTPTTVVWLGSPTPDAVSSTPSASVSASASASASAGDKFAGALDVEPSASASGTPNGPSGSVADQLKHCLPAIIVLAVVAALFLVGAVVYCVVARRRRSGVRESAYTNIHYAEGGAQQRALYGHDEDATKYADPYHDRI